MARYIHIGDSRGRDAEVVFSGQSKMPAFRHVTLDGGAIKKVRVIKGTATTSFETIARNLNGDAGAVASTILDADPDIDLQWSGRIIGNTSRVYIGQDLKPVAVIQKKECLYAPDGTLTEERIPKELLANILTENPLRPGRVFPKKDLYNKFVFAKKYQIRHINGLTFDFLYEIARELYKKNSLAMLGGGEKGTDPLVFQDGGKSYRAFLEGRVREETYLLILHLSNLELKSVT